jgi:uncharacterized protein involved in copper resistance
LLERLIASLAESLGEAGRQVVGPSLAQAARSPGCAATTEPPVTVPPATEPEVIIEPDEGPAAAATATAEATATTEGNTTTEGSATADGGATTEATATSAASKPAATATMETTASATMAATTTAATMAATTTAAAATMAATTTTASAARQLHAAAKVLSIEEMERGQTDVGHFLFAKNEALIGRGIVRLRDTGSGYCGCGSTTRQRKTQSGGTEHLHGGGFGCAFLLRSLLDPWHGRILRI